MAINLHQLRIFNTVVRLGSFSRAATELSLSQPSVSIQVTELERQFEVELFERVGNSVRLTGAGHILDDYTRRIFALIDEARRAMDELKGLHAGRLLIGASSTPGTYLLPDLLARLKAQHPRLEIVLRVASPLRIQEMVLAHQIDVGVIGWTVTLSDLEALPMVTDELVLVTAPGHRFASLPEVELAEAVREPFILRERGSGVRESFDDAIRRAGVRITPALELEGTEIVKQAVAANLGIAVLPRCAVDLEVSSGRLRIVPIRGLHVERAIWLIYHRTRALPRIAQAFIGLATSGPQTTAPAASPAPATPAPSTPPAPSPAPAGPGV